MISVILYITYIAFFIEILLQLLHLCGFLFLVHWPNIRSYVKDLKAAFDTVDQQIHALQHWKSLGQSVINCIKERLLIRERS